MVALLVEERLGDSQVAEHSHAAACPGAEACVDNRRDGIQAGAVLGSRTHHNPMRQEVAAARNQAEVGTVHHEVAVYALCVSRPPPWRIYCFLDCWAPIFPFSILWSVASSLPVREASRHQMQAALA